MERVNALFQAYFVKGEELEEIAKRLAFTVEEASRILGDEVKLDAWRKRSEAAKVRAQICVNETAERAARQQARLLEVGTESVTQRAAKDILDRAGVGTSVSDKQVEIRFLHEPITLGMPEGTGE